MPSEITFLLESPKGSPRPFHLSQTSQTLMGVPSAAHCSKFTLISLSVKHLEIGVYDDVKYLNFISSLLSIFGRNECWVFLKYLMLVFRRMTCPPRLLQPLAAHIFIYFNLWCLTVEINKPCLLKGLALVVWLEYAAVLLGDCPSLSNQQQSGLVSRLHSFTKGLVNALFLEAGCV